MPDRPQEPPPAAPALLRRRQPPRTAAEWHALGQILAQYNAFKARIMALQAVPEEEWAQRFTKPREEVLANVRRIQQPLVDQLRAAGVLPGVPASPGREDGTQPFP
jgi:hypothetical protein